MAGISNGTPTKLASRDSRRGEASSSRRCNVTIWFLIFSNLLVFQFTYFHKQLFSEEGLVELILPKSILRQQQQSGGGASSSNPFVLDFETGPAVALPSVRIEKEEETTDRKKIYGGAGDKKHLGGFTEIDLMGISPAVWKHMISYFGIKSMLDVGCGRGISTSWFALHGVDALCVEGSHDAVSKSMLPDPSTQVVEHDFSRGPWWPPRTVDAVWCVEFLEHVGRNFHHNYLPAFRKAALIFVSHSTWGGWHHVEVHDEVWWIAKMEAYGFRYSQDLTTMVRNTASAERNNKTASVVPGQAYNAQHVWTKMKVFINPSVAALPEHAHLFAEHGCYKDRGEEGKIIHRECGSSKKQPEESRMPDSFYPIQLTESMDKDWEALVKKNIKVEAAGKK